MYIYFYLFDPKQELKDHRRRGLLAQETTSRSNRQSHRAREPTTAPTAWATTTCVEEPTVEAEATIGLEQIP